MKILFVCKHNRFRSKIAEAYFNKINKNKKYKAVSAGLVEGKPLAKSTISIAKKFGINIRDPPRPLDEKFLESKELGIIIIVANNVPKRIFKSFNKKIIVWKIPDAGQTNEKYVRRRIEAIINKINKFVYKLNRGKIKWKQ